MPHGLSAGSNPWEGLPVLQDEGEAPVLNTTIDLVVDAGRAAARVLYTGAHIGPLLGQPATGRLFACHGAAFFHASAGRPASACMLGDLAPLREQLAEPSTQELYSRDQ